MAHAVPNAMTVDVEDYFHVAALSGAINRNDWDSQEYRAETSTRRLIEIFGDRGINATFFVLGWIAKRSPGLIKDIQRAGHEVACHGMSHKLIYSQTPEEFYQETRDSKALLEDIIGQSVNGYRAASWSITNQSLWALDIIHDLGFQYDSSIFPIHHDIYGIPGAPKKPGIVVTPSGHNLVEFPPSTASWLGFRLPVAGGGYFRLLPYWLTRAGLRQINGDENQAFIFYLHPWEIDPGQPRVKAGLISRFRHYTNLGQTQKRLQRLMGEFSFTTVRNVLGNAGLLAA